MKKSFEYDQTKYDPSAPKKTEEFLTADGVKTLTTDANDGAVLIQDEVDGDSLNPVTGAAVAAAIEAGGGSGGGNTVLANGVSMDWDSEMNYCYHNISSDVASKITTGVYLVSFVVNYSTAPSGLGGTGIHAMITAGIWGDQSGFESKFVLLPDTNQAGTSRELEGTGVFTIDNPSFVPGYFRLQLSRRAEGGTGSIIETAPDISKITVIKLG